MDLSMEANALYKKILNERLQTVNTVVFLIGLKLKEVCHKVRY